uniref:Reverse transcriptase domain-containing protein n=2 Tax=Haemonchus contortus TaxID=6289 RepID=A0A7I4Y992_HAECO
MSTSPQQTFPLSGVYLPLAPTPNPTGFVPPPPCLPQLRCLPPPLPLPPPPPPPPPPPLAPTYAGFHSNNWTSPTTTYTRVAVEDLFVTNTVSAKMPMVWPPSTRSSQLNPNANPFQPAYQRSQPLPQAHRSCQPANANPLQIKSTANLKQTTSHNTSPPSETKQQRSSIVPSQSLPQHTFVSRGTMYFGQTTGSPFEDENEATVVSDTETSVEPERKPQLLDSMTGILKPVPKRDIAKMMWEAADLYDNAIRTIQERRAELQKLRERKKSKNKGDKAKKSTDSTVDIDPEVIVRDIVKSSHHKAARERRHGTEQTRKPFLYLMQDPYLGDGQSGVKDYPTRYGQLSQTKLAVQTEEITTKATDSRAINSKSQSVSHAFVGKEVTVDEIASAIMRMETDLFRRRGGALHMTKAAVTSVVEEVQRYIIDQLKLDPVRAQDRTACGTSKVQKVRLDGAPKLCELTEEGDKSTAARNKGNGILTYDGKEVTVKVIVKAIVKMIREIYGRRPPFRVSRSALTEFVANKQEKIFKVLKLKAFDWTNSDELKSNTPVITEVQSKNYKVKELPEFTISSLKTARAPKARRKIKPIFIRRSLSSIENKKVRKKKGRPADDLADSQRRILKPRKNRPRQSSERPSKEKLESVNTAIGPVEKGTICSSIQPNVKSVAAAADIDGEEKWSADDESNGTSRSGSSKDLRAVAGKFTRCYLTRRSTFRYRTERSFYSYSTNSRYRGRLHKMFVSGMSPRNGKKASPKKRISTESADEEKTTTVNSSDVIVPAVTDSSSIYGRMTAAPTSIVIRTVEKKSKKRGKKGWRKSWI